MEILTTNMINTVSYITIEKKFSQFVDEFHDMGINDFDELVDGVRVCVDFDTIHINGLKIKSIEITDWDNDEPIDNEYSFTLRQSIRNKVTEYNNTPLITEDSLQSERNFRDMIMNDRW